MSNLYDTANQLERELRESQEFKAVEERLAAVNNNEEAIALFNEFRDVNVALQQKQMSGQEVTEEDIANAQAIYQRASENEYIKALTEAEQRLNVVMQDINRIITASLQTLYQPK